MEDTDMMNAALGGGSPGDIQGRARYRAALGLAFLVLPVAAFAADITGTVEFQGQVVFPAAIPGIDAEDLDVAIKATAEATGPGETCDILGVSTDAPDADGTYPGASGMVTAQIQLSRGGPQIPDGDCIVTVQAGATDGASISARGARIVFVTAAEIGGGATVAVPDIAVRQSKAVAGIDTDCFRWAKRQIRKLRRCNLLLLPRGAAVADRCSDAGPEPAGCDPGDFAEAIVALSHGVNDQRTDPFSAESIELPLLRAQLGCQRKFGSAALGYAFRRLRLVRSQCVNNEADSAACRDDQSRAARRPLDRVDRCSVDQMTDGMTGRPVPDLGDPCDVCIDEGSGAIDRKCIKSCFEEVLEEFTDGIVGDVAVCGNGILQPGEFCDDGNTSDGDCCSSACAAENLGDQMCGTGACEVTVPACQAGAPVTCVPGTPGSEGPDGDPTCSDGIDNDCDGDTDGVDLDCQP
jgi:cysteine-rich repeat protein